MEIITWFRESVMGNTLMVVFLVAFIGYLVGSIKIRGVELGTAGVLLVAFLATLDLRCLIWCGSWD